VSQETQQVLIIDDQPGEILWLIDRIRHRRATAVVATNEGSGRAELSAVRGGERKYVLAIIDVMVAIKGLSELIAHDEDLDEEFFEKSTETGIRLCRYAREELGLTESELPIAVLTVRSEDSEVREAIGKRLGIPIYPRIPTSDPSPSIVDFLDQHLPLPP